MRGPPWRWHCAVTLPDTLAASFRAPKQPRSWCVGGTEPRLCAGCALGCALAVPRAAQQGAGGNSEAISGRLANRLLRARTPVKRARSAACDVLAACVTTCRGPTRRAPPRTRSECSDRCHVGAHRHKRTVRQPHRCCVNWGPSRAAAPALRPSLRWLLHRWLFAASPRVRSLRTCLAQTDCSTRQLIVCSRGRHTPLSVGLLAVR